MLLLLSVLFLLPKAKQVVAINNKKLYEYDSFILPKIKFNDVISSGFQTPNYIASMFQTYGAVQITNIPNFKEIKNNALKSLPECFLSDISVTSKTMKDGSRRLSAAAISKDGTTGKVSSICGESTSMTDLRFTIDITTQSVFKALDLASVKNSGSNKNPYVMFPYKSFSSLMTNAIQLEHLHAYFPNKNVSNSDNRNTLDMHVDAGIMIAMTSGLYSTDSDNDIDRSDLFVELPSGTVVSVKTDPDAIILLAGNAANRWLSPSLGQPIRAIPHFLSVQGEGVTSRSWYGKMFLPPGDAKIPSKDRDLTYSQFRQMEQDYHSLSTTPSREFVSLACGEVNEDQWLFDLSGNGDTDNCPSGSIYCWMQCQPTTSLPCGDNAICINSKTNEPVDPNLMCGPTCVPGCPVVVPTTKNSSNAYCLSPGVSMYMDGFTAMASQSPGTVQCINLLFVSWTLDSALKFGFACVGVFFMGILIQALTYVRLSLSKDKYKNGQTMTSLYTIGLYTIQMVLSYLIMLVAMTYSVELFCMVCSGLMVGYSIFHLKMPEPSTTDQCCPDETDIVYSNLSNKE